MKQTRQTKDKTQAPRERGVTQVYLPLSPPERNEQPVSNDNKDKDKLLGEMWD